MQEQNGSPPSGSNTAPKQQKRRTPPGQPFVKGDPRINRKGRPRSFDQLRALAQSIASEVLTSANGEQMTVIDAILRSWAKSKEPMLQKSFVEFAYGRVPEKLETTGLEGKTTLILHYGHEKQKRDDDHQRMASDVSPSAD